MVSVVEQAIETILPELWRLESVSYGVSHKQGLLRRYQSKVVMSCQVVEEQKIQTR